MFLSKHFYNDKFVYLRIHREHTYFINFEFEMLVVLLHSELNRYYNDSRRSLFMSSHCTEFIFFLIITVLKNIYCAYHYIRT